MIFINTSVPGASAVLTNPRVQPGQPVNRSARRPAAPTQGALADIARDRHGEQQLCAGRPPRRSSGSKQPAAGRGGLPIFLNKALVTRPLMFKKGENGAKFAPPTWDVRGLA